MAKKKVTVEDQNLENVQEALNTTSAWIEKNQNKLTWAVTVVVAVVVGVLALNTYVIKPKAVEVSNENAKAEAYFMQGNWEIGLNGEDAECLGSKLLQTSTSVTKVVSWLRCTQVYATTSWVNTRMLLHI